MNEPKWDGQRWRIRVMQDGKTHSFSCKTPGTKGRKEVTRLYHEWLYGEGSGEKTVNQVAREYLDDIQARRGKGCEAYVQNECYIRLYVAPVCGSKKICKMTQRDWQAVINEASGANGKPLAHKTLLNLRGMIMGIIKFGYQDYQCELLRGELYIPVGHARAEKEILQEADIQRLLEPSDKWYHPLFCFLAITGMRPGEALGLQVKDVLESSVHIRRAVNARQKITEGKNENAKRIIPIGALARSILRKTIRRNEEHKLHTQWIFCDLNGNPGSQSTMRKQWNALKKERDLPGTVYSLRHTFISMMKNVMPEQMIKDIVGHSVSMDTFGTYGHIIEGDSDRAAKIIDLKFNFDQNLPEEK